MPEALTQWVLAHPDLTVTLTVLLTLAAVALTVALSVALRGRGAWQTRAHEAENRVAALTSDLGAKQQWLDQAEGERRQLQARLDELSSQLQSASSRLSKARTALTSLYDVDCTATDSGMPPHEFMPLSHHGSTRSPVCIIRELYLPW